MFYICTIISTFTHSQLYHMINHVFNAISPLGISSYQTRWVYPQSGNQEIWERHVILKNAVCYKRTLYWLPFRVTCIIFHGICLELVMKLDKLFKTHFIKVFNDNSCNIRSYIYQTVDSLFIQFTLLQQIILAIQDSNNKNKATSKVEYIFNYFIVKYW